MRPNSEDAVATTRTERPPSLWRNRAFNLLWGSQCLSDLGSAMANLAMPLLVLQLTGSPTQAGLVGTTSLLVGLVCRLPAGVLADRLDRRRLMIVCDGFRIVAYAVLWGAVLAGEAGVTMVLVVVVGGAAANALFSTVEHAAVRNLVPSTELATAVARNEARSYGTSLAGPPLGGLLFGLGRSLPFLGNALSYLLSLVAVLLIRQPMQQPREQSAQSGGAAGVEGLRFVLGNPFLRALLLIAAPLNMAFTGMMFAIVVSLQRAGASSFVVGLASTIFGLGGFLGAFAAPALQRWMRLPTLILVLCWVSAGLIAVSSLFSTGVLAAVPLAAAVFLGPTANSALFGYQAAITPDHLQGRVVSVILLVAMSATALAPGLAGLLLAHFSSGTVMLVFALILAVSAVTATFGSGIRTMSTEP
ncbi:MFS transporter [Streptomyces sp. NBC_00344]|uniref:MFS transporter n=1 Tax=Streptomyces sp. NBC_00344 TaxID=2975720 RepID=UPI002E1A8DD6